MVVVVVVVGRVRERTGVAGAAVPAARNLACEAVSALYTVTKRGSSHLGWCRLTVVAGGWSEGGLEETGFLADVVEVVLGHRHGGMRQEESEDSLGHEERKSKSAAYEEQVIRLRDSSGRLQLSSSTDCKRIGSGTATLRE